MAKRITIDLLIKEGACSDQCALFAELFPNGTEVTEELCIRYTKQFDFDWALGSLLPEEAWAEVQQVRLECQRIRNEAWTKYERIYPDAWAKYRRIQNEPQAKFQHTKHEALAEYDRVAKKAWTECDHIYATEFARLWNKYMSD